jgi:hypothetical protein
MIHPLLRLVISQPQLVAEHANAYAGLVGEGVSQTIDHIRLRVILSAVALGLLIVSVVLAGVALMLWAVTPAASMQAPWALIAGPAVPAVAAVICLVVGMKKPVDTFAEVKQQFAADMTMLREVGAA